MSPMLLAQRKCIWPMFRFPIRPGVPLSFNSFGSLRSRCWTSTKAQPQDRLRLRLGFRLAHSYFGSEGSEGCLNDPERGECSIHTENFDVLASPAGWHAIPYANDPASRTLC